MEIKKGNQQFFIGDNENDAIARITYTVKDDSTIIANHTFVDPKLRGQNIAKQLLDALADFAREESLKIEPTCSYVVRMFEKSNTYDDIKV